MTLVIVDPAIAAEKFLKQAFTLKHSLADHPLFTLPRLVELAKAMPPQKAPGVSPAGDTVKVFAHDAMRAAIDPLRKSETARKIIRGLIYGRKANYYYEAKAGQEGCESVPIFFTASLELTPSCLHHPRNPSSSAKAEEPLCPHRQIDGPLSRTMTERGKVVSN